MFKYTINALERSKDKSLKPFKFKRVLKNLNKPNEKLRDDILFHSFFNKYANHPIPIKSLTNTNTNQTDKFSILEELDEEDSDLIRKNGFLLSMIQNELPLSKLFDNNTSKPIYSLDNSLFQILNKAKANKDENIVAHAKMKPFTRDFKFDKARYFSEYKKFLEIKKANQNIHNNIYSFHPDNIEPIKGTKLETNVIEKSKENNTLDENKTEEDGFNITVDKLVYKNLGKSKRAGIALRRFSKKHNLNLSDKDIFDNLRPLSKFNFQNNYFKIKDKDILVPKLKSKKYGTVYCWEVTD